MYDLIKTKETKYDKYFKSNGPKLKHDKKFLGCVCLEVKHGGWKILERKQEGKHLQAAFGWMGRKENKWWGSGVFPPIHQKFFSQNEEKTEQR